MDMGIHGTYAIRRRNPTETAMNGNRKPLTSSIEILVNPLTVNKTNP